MGAWQNFMCCSKSADMDVSKKKKDVKRQDPEKGKAVEIEVDPWGKVDQKVEQESNMEKPKNVAVSMIKREEIEEKKENLNNNNAYFCGKRYENNSKRKYRLYM